jgi:hypothetical protein
MSIPVFKIKTTNYKKLWSSLLQILILIGILIGAYFLGVFITSKNALKNINKANQPDFVSTDQLKMQEEKDEELTKKIETVNQRLNTITTNPYDCTYLGGCTRLYPTYPYPTYPTYPTYPYHNYLRYSPYHRDIMRGGNIDLHKKRNRK